MFLLLTMIAVAVSMEAQVPDEILKMNDLPNAGSLYLKYCVVHGPCIYRHAIAFGQVCDQGTADSMGYACTGDIEGRVPSGYRYAGWKCQIFESSKLLTGKSGDDPCPTQSKNRR